MREVVLVNAFLGCDAAEYICVVGNDGVNAAVDHIAHISSSFTVKVLTFMPRLWYRSTSSG